MDHPSDNILYLHFIKPFFDFFFASVFFLMFLPFFLILCVVLYINNKGKVFFLQARPGKKEKVFKVIKFKTMNDRVDNNGKLLSDEYRLTDLGKFIRKTSLDEIPQLLNVIKGDMSLIGPRPLLQEYLPFYNKIQKKRHNVKPGITGWAQVNGRNAISWEKKFEYDVWYVENLSFILDIKIFLLTINKVFYAKGISADKHVTMPTFIDHIKSRTKL